MIRLEVTYYMRRRDVIEALGKLGIREEEIDKAIKSKLLSGRQFSGPASRAYYCADATAAVFGLCFETRESKCFIFSQPQTR